MVRDIAGRSPDAIRAGKRLLDESALVDLETGLRLEAELQAFYDKLLAKGKTKMQALIAVMRKLLHAIHGMLRHDQDFDGEKFFALRG